MAVRPGRGAHVAGWTLLRRPGGREHMPYGQVMGKDMTGVDLRAMRRAREDEVAAEMKVMEENIARLPFAEQEVRRAGKQGRARQDNRGADGVQDG